MMMRKKGQVAILAGLGLLAAVVIGGGFMIGDLQSLLELIIENWTILFASVLGLGVTATFIINSYQKNPQWKKDIAGLGALVGILIAIPLIWGVVPHPETTYDADCRITVRNPALSTDQDSRILRVDVSNFQKQSPLSIMRPESLSFWPEDKLSVKYTVFCDGDKVDDGGFGITLLEMEADSKTQVIGGLPEGGNCEVRIDLMHEPDGTQIDEETYTFRVPRGEG